MAIVQTVDFFPPLVDDAYTFGQVAAANALSDIYAMGATPLTALNIVGYPDNVLSMDILADILRGGAERASVAGCVILGGHSVRDAEIKYGLAVTGTIHPDRIVTNAGARPGDVLVLTKPIGSGTLTTAAKKNEISQDDLAGCIDVMVELNASASGAMMAVGVNAATDVTGFGLLGHAFEVSSASNATLNIRAADVPLMAGAYELAKKGIVTRAHKTNLAYVGRRLRLDMADQTLVHLLADAQTSGGLLIAVAADRRDRLVARLQAAGAGATVIGHVSAPSDFSLVLT